MSSSSVSSSKDSSRTYDVLIFGAHPDDAEMAMGGTLARLAEAGHRVLLVSLTRSEMSTHGTTETRQKEAEAAAKVFGCGTRLLDFPDTRVENTPAGRDQIVEIIRAHRPRLVFAPYHTNPLGEPGGVANVDHYNTGGLVRDAVKLARLEKVLPASPKHTVGRLYFYMLPRNVQPTFLVDVSMVEERMLKGIRCYATQMAIEVKGNSIEHVLLTSRAAQGLPIGALYAEGFVTDVPPVLGPQHLFEI